MTKIFALIGVFIVGLAITVAMLTTTTTTPENLFSIKYAFAQQQQPIEGGPGGQTLTGDPNLPYPGNQMYGDTSQSLTSGGRGGNDQMTGGTSSQNSMFGDASVMSGSTEGNDQMIGGSDNSFNYMHGDANEMYGSAGGNDQMTGGSDNSFNNMYGDAGGIMLDERGNSIPNMVDSTGGNDQMTG
jgi:hypothetical protein